MSMFCYQCSETAKGKGCEIQGICGKDEEVSNLFDLLIWICKGISFWATKAHALGIKDSAADHFVCESLFMTITNVNFNSADIMDRISLGLERKNSLEQKVKMACERRESCPEKSQIPEAATWTSDSSLDRYLEKAKRVGVLSIEDRDIRSLKELMIYGLKGIAAYTDHAMILGKESQEIYDFMHQALKVTLEEGVPTDELTNWVMKTGSFAVQAMALLDQANTSRFGHPELTEVDTGTREGYGILISGHDLLDLEELLQQTEGKGIQVYTHGEMLPANAYPKLKRYSHLAGNYGTSWYNQQKEFASFPGAILMTTNCIQKPTESYRDRIFTTGLVGWPSVHHIPNRRKGQPKDFTPLIEKALSTPKMQNQTGKKLTIGLAHNQVDQVAGAVVKAIKDGLITKFVVMAGCDGHAKERNYYTEVAKSLPESAVILTAGCAKYRYNMLDLGTVGGIPRLIDAGQCNDSYSLVRTALKLKEAFGVESINDLPIAYDIAWYEQKAVAVLLALLSLGVKGIRLGPVLPAFVSPAILDVLVSNFEIRPIGTVAEDVAQIMA